MVFNINNKSVSERIELCIDEFTKITSIIEGIGSMSHPVPYLTRYAIVRACGAIEYGFKTIISDANSNEQTEQIKRFIDKKFRNSSINPSYSNICKSLSEFDESWAEKFKKEIDSNTDKARILDSLDSLNQARNSFAHGGSPSASFLNVKSYFSDSVRVLESIEQAIV
ncbi:MAG TPA: HEPN domain-containing protein [Methylotenera sp.]|nr:HEPN domain-containing protein [Methylotenera sp.]